MFTLINIFIKICNLIWKKKTNEYKKKVAEKTRKSNKYSTHWFYRIEFTYKPIIVANKADTHIH